MLRSSILRRTFATSSSIRVNLKGVEGKKNIDEGKRFSLYMDDVFKSTNPEEINHYITTFLPRMKISSVVSLLTTAFDNRYRLSEQQIEMIAGALENGRQPLKPKQAVDIIHSLGRYKGPTPAILSLMRVVAKDFTKNSQLIVPLSPRNICGMLTGMQGMYAIHPEEKDILRLIKSEIESSPATFTPRDLFFALQGLQNLTSSIPEVRGLLSALISKPYDSIYTFNANEMSTCIYALRNMRTTEIEVIDTIAFLVQNMRSSPIRFDELAIAKSLIGVSNLECSKKIRDIPIAEMLDLLSEQVEQFEDIFDLNSVVNAVTSLKFKDDSVPSVGRLYRALADKIYSTDMKSQRKFAGRGRMCKNKDVIAKIFTALHHLSRASADVRYLRESLIQRLRFELTTKEGRLGFVDLDDATLCAMTHGLSEMRNTSLSTKRGVIDSTCVKEVDDLWLLVSQMVRASTLLQLHHPESICRISRSLKNLSLPLSESRQDTSENTEIKHLLASLTRLFDTTVKSRGNGSDGPRWTLEEVFQCIQGLRYMHTSHSEVEQLLTCYAGMLREALTAPHKPLTADALTHMVRSMSEKDARHKSASDIFQIILKEIASTGGSNAEEHLQLSPVQYASCLSGLSGSSSDNKSVQAILAYLNGHVDFIFSKIENHELAESRFVTFTAILAGLRHMSIDNAEVRRALVNVAAFMNDERERGGPGLTLRCKGYISAFEHLKHWDASLHPEVEDVLGQLVGVLRGNRMIRSKFLGARGVVLALTGLQSTDISGSGVAIDLLIELSANIKGHATTQYDIRAICDIVNGFRSTLNVEGIEAIDEFMMALLERYPSDKIESMSPSDILKFASGMRRIHSSSSKSAQRLWDTFVETVSTAQIVDDNTGEDIMREKISDLLHHQDYKHNVGATRILAAVLQKHGYPLTNHDGTPQHS